MYAIVEIAGQQFKVEQDKYIYTHRLEAKEGESIAIDRVLLVDNEGAIEVGAPNVDTCKIQGKVLEHLKGDKVLVFKKKRRKGYRKTQGHRQYLTKLLIENISI